MGDGQTYRPTLGYQRVTHGDLAARQPKGKVLVHSDQDSQYASADYVDFMKEHNSNPFDEPTW